METAQESIEEDFHTFEMIRIQRGSGGLEGFEVSNGVWQGLRGLLAQGCLHLMVPMEEGDHRNPQEMHSVS